MALTKIKTGSVSDSITLTTPDINGGTIDATVIGGNTAAAGTFTDVVAASLDISGNIDVDGVTNLDVVDIDGAVDMASTLAVAGVVTANAGVVVDTITIDGSTITSSGSLTLDLVGNLTIDVDGTVVSLSDAGVNFGQLFNSGSGNFNIYSPVSNQDMIFRGNDGGSAVTMLSLDASASGAATFNDRVTSGNHFAVIPSTTTNYAYAEYQNSGGSMYVGRERSVTGGLMVGSTPYAGLINVFNSYPLEFGTNNIKRMTIHNDTKVEFGTFSNTGGTAGMYHEALSGGPGGGIVISGTTTGFKYQMRFFSPNGQVGYIKTDGTATAYVTSSDYRLKENVVPMTGSIDRVKALNPSRFNFIADADTTVDGFLAHEVEAVVPEAISGTKDAMRDEEYEAEAAVEEVRDEDDNITTEASEAVMGTRSVPDMQGIDQSKLVPLLVAALQEAIARIEILEGA